MAIKMRKEKGKFIVKNDSKEIIFPTMHDALEYAFYRKFMAQVAGEPIGVHNDTLYPVYSLIPPAAEKGAKFIDLGAEVC